MQTTYLEAVTRFDKFNQGSSREFLAWLWRLAENNLIDGVRALEAAKRPDPSKRVTGKSAEGDSMSSLVTVLGVTFTTPSINVARSEAGDHLMMVVEQLPDVYRRVVKLYDLENKSIEEVAAEVGRSQGAVYMLRARAHEQLKELLGRESRYFSMK
jgi:RNA polymerase sigma factor (sigma-70 family)